MAINKTFLSMILFLIGSSGIGHTAPITINVNNRDHYLRQKIQDQVKEREQTRKQEDIYLGKEIFELKTALESGDNRLYDDFKLFSQSVNPINGLRPR